MTSQQNMLGVLPRFKQLVLSNFARADFTYREWMGAYHLEIVERIAMELCDMHPEADRDVVTALVWFHDFGKPFDEDREREITRVEGPKALVSCGCPQTFADTVLERWKLMERKNELDLRTAPIETQIVSSADGASHFVGVFYPSYFGDGLGFEATQARLREKIGKDWERKIVLPEVRDAFRARYEYAREMLGEFPARFL
jgi:hypothetical protein